MEEMEHPEQFNKGILGSRILERFNNGILRVTSVPDADVREKIVFDYKKGTLSSQLVGHPVLVGVIEKKIVPHPELKDSFFLESHIEWETTSAPVDSMIRRNMERFVTQSLESVKSTAETRSIAAY
jgi:hypothetical protein